MRETLLRVFVRLARERTKTVLAVGVSLALLSGLLAATQLRMDSNQDHLISRELPYQDRYLSFLEEFGDLECLYAVIDGRKNPAQARAFADALAAGLRAQPEHFSQVHARVETSDFGGNLLLLAPEAELQELETLKTSPEDLRAIASSESLAQLFDLLSDSLQRDPEGTSASAQERGWRLLQGLVAAVDSSVTPDATGATRAPPVGPVVDLLLPALEIPVESAYEEHSGLFLVSFMPVKDYSVLDPVQEPLRRARQTLRDLQARFPDTPAGVTGRPALLSDEVSQTTADMTLASILALVGVGLVFMLFFRSVVRPLLTLLSLVIGIAWSAGFATLAVGQLNFLSSVFGVILVGIGVDFGIHLLARYQQGLASHGDVGRALEDAVVHVGKGNLTAALTTAVAFFSALLTDFEGLIQLGVIAGSGVLLCCLSMLLMLPAALYSLDEGRVGPRGLHPLPTFAVLERIGNRPWRTLSVVAILVFLAAAWAPGVIFDENLLNLQSPKVESVHWERELLNTDASTWVTASIVDTEEEAIARHAELAALEPVARVESVATFLGPGPAKVAERLREVRRALGPLPEAALEANVDGAQLSRALERFGEELEGLAEAALSRELTEETEEILDLAERVTELSGRIPGKSAALDEFQTALLAGIGARSRRLVRLLDPPGWTLATIPPWIRSRLVGKSGKIAVYAFPRESLWPPEAMDRFLIALETVDPNVTGVTVSVRESSRVLKESFRILVGVTLVAILLVVLVEYRHWRGLIALVPLAVGGIWFLGALAFLGVSFNMGNFFIVSVLIGLGIDDGVHMLNRSLEDPHGPLVSHATGTGVVLSSLTTIVGFGALMTSQHAGLASMGKVMSLGALMLLLSAVFAQPALSRLAFRNSPAKDKEPSEEAPAPLPEVI